ncbi:D-amino acid oxidase [Vermiconidia calcicola]|uniref:D-amino acid oxidase n=1 Tax=Vermiconidia calcicola TaxID=1690605 RepID=A0ACC3NW18_9PEZI|nr:D-amino acid oxidase [Vermiconidia calcicola]
MDAGISFTSCLKAGVILRRGIVSHIAEAANLHYTGRPADLVVNCTGLSACRLGGVEDKLLLPVRGQTVLVRNDPGIIVGSTGTDDGPDEVIYVMNRAGGGGCILGGCSLENVWESQPDFNLATRIMKRAVELCPSLVPPGKGIEALSIIRHSVGLRPMRIGGVRIEQETLQDDNGRSFTVVHNYGHGGAGYQTSYGTATAAVNLVQEALQPNAKL